MGTDVSKTTSTGYSELLAEYKQMQTAAYTRQDVTADQLVALKEKIDSFIQSNVTDAAQKEKLSKSFASEFDAMHDAVDKKTTSNKTSNAEWDQSREDMQALLTELAPEGEVADIYDPTADTALRYSGQNLAVTAGQAVDASSADMTGVDAFMAQHPEAEPYLDMVKSASVKYKPSTPVRVLLAQIEAESGFNPKAVGPFGEQGLSQFTAGTWAQYGEGGYENAQDPQAAINAQANYMAQLQKDNGGNLAYALETYNGWERDKSYDYNVSKRCSPTYVQDITGQPYDQRQDSTG